MNMIELHIIQSFPVTCLNRDDLGAPKTALFGGVQRARVSSQSWKRAIRSAANEMAPANFAGQRTRYIIGEIKNALVEKELQEEKAVVLALAIADAVGKLDDPEKGNVKTLLYISPMEIANVAEVALNMECGEDIDAVIAAEDDMKKREKALAALTKKMGKAAKALKDKVKDNADIALFGRMVADDHSLMLEGAACFSHALSTHKVSNEIDFFSAVDDIMPEGEEGAGHIGTLEFNSACYYRYVGINLDLLRDDDHLGHFSEDEFDSVLKTFIRACLTANPSARKNSQFGHTLPSFALGLKRSGQPLSLANAFEEPVYKKGGIAQASQEKLMKHYQELARLWSITSEVQTTIPPENIDGFIAKLTGKSENNDDFSLEG